MALDVVDHNKIIYGEADQPGAALGGFRQQLDAFSDGGMFVQDLIAEGDRVVARLLVSGVHTGFHPACRDRSGRPPLRGRADLDLQPDDGKVTEIRAVSDRLGLFAQLGWD